MTYSQRLIMTGRNLTPDFIQLLRLTLLIGFLSSSAALASSNNVSTMCLAGDINMDPIPLPISSTNNTNSGANKIDTTACLVPSLFTDGVKCFTPGNTCDIRLTGEGDVDGNETRVAITSGTCSDSPASCTGSALTNQIASFAVTAGTQYCIYIETTIDQQIGYTLESDPTDPGNDCGSMPVELLHFTIE